MASEIGSGSRLKYEDNELTDDDNPGGCGGGGGGAGAECLPEQTACRRLSHNVHAMFATTITGPLFTAGDDDV